MCFVFGKTYTGFCTKTQPYLSDSEAKVSSSADDGSESEDCHPIDEVWFIASSYIRACQGEYSEEEKEGKPGLEQHTTSFENIPPAQGNYSNTYYPVAQFVSNFSPTVDRILI